MAIKRPRPTFDAAAKGPDGRLNLDLQQALIHHDSRMEVIERALGIGGLSPDKLAKVAVVPPRADVSVATQANSGQLTVSLTNPEFIRGRGNPMRTPIYHKVRYSPDPSFRNAVTELPPSVQTHWPIRVTPGSQLHLQVLHSYDGINWSLPIIKGPFKA